MITGPGNHTDIRMIRCNFKESRLDTLIMMLTVDCADGTELLLSDPEVTANLYSNVEYLYWEGCVICSMYLR